MQVYFAAPLFSEAEKEFNRKWTGELEAAGHDVFLPQRDGKEADQFFEESDVESMEDVMEKIFELDRDAIYGADVMTAVLDGQVPDEGVALEMGLAYENDVPIVALKTDRRTFSEGEEINAMLWGALDVYVETPEELVEAVDDLDG